MAKSKLTSARKWLIGIIGTIALGLITNVLDRRLNYSKITDWSKQAIVNAFEWVFNILNYPVRLWIVILIVGFLVYIVFWATVKAMRGDDIDNSHLNFLNYTSDKFGVDKSKWSWRFVLNRNNNYEFTDVAPNCPTCDSPLKMDEFFNGAFTGSCSRCRLEGRHYHYRVRENVDDVSIEIERRIKAKEFVNS